MSKESAVHLKYIQFKCKIYLNKAGGGKELNNKMASIDCFLKIRFAVLWNIKYRMNIRNYKILKESIGVVKRKTT